MRDDLTDYFMDSRSNELKYLLTESMSDSFGDSCKRSLADPLGDYVAGFSFVWGERALARGSLPMPRNVSFS